jgi:flagellar hook-associated protein 1 FlgK
MRSASTAFRSLAATAPNSNSTGTLAAMVQMRDTVTVTCRAQLDEIARGMVTTFAESDTAAAVRISPGCSPMVADLQFRLAGTLSHRHRPDDRVNAAFDPSVGGDPELLRDGGANGAAYVSNTTGGAGYSPSA